MEPCKLVYQLLTKVSTSTGTLIENEGCLARKLSRELIWLEKKALASQAVPKMCSFITRLRQHSVASHDQF